MQISPLAYTQPIAPVQTISAPATAETSATVETIVADDVSLSTSSATAVPSKTALPQTDMEITKALNDIFASASETETVVMPSRTEGVQQDSAPVEVGGFLLADGSAAVGLGGNDGTGIERVPTREDFADYTFIDPEDATDNYLQNVRGKINGIERAVIKAYCSFAYKKMNGYLWGLNKSPIGVVKRADNCLVNTLNRFDVPPGSVLYRTAYINELRSYVTPEEFDKYKAINDSKQTEKLAQILDLRLSGTQTTRKSFLSTTIDPKFDFVDKAKVTTKMYVGDNVHGIYVAADPRLSSFPDEQEYLLPPGTKMTVLGVDYNAKNKGMVLHVMLGDMPADKTASDMVANN